MGEMGEVFKALQKNRQKRHNKRVKSSEKGNEFYIQRNCLPFSRGK